MTAFTNRTDEVSVSLERKVKHYSDTSVPGILQHGRLVTEQIPDLAPRKVRVVDLVHLKLCLRVGEIKLLDYVVVSVDKLGTFDHDIVFHTINLILEE